MTRKAAIYVRVSTDEQDPEHQVRVLETFASQQNIKVHKIYKDVVSGAKSSRPALNDLMFDSRAGLFNMVLVWKLDRLGRSLKHLIGIVEEWNQRNIDFVCISQNIDTRTSGGKLVFHIFGAIAEFERELISERTKLGMKKALKEGRVGRPKGKKDSQPRNKSGYYVRYMTKKRGGV